MFEDEAGFGRISEPSNCWAPPKKRPAIPCQRVRQYKTAYGAVSPLDGKSMFLVLDKSNTENMNIFLKALSEKFADDMVLLCLDRASWHRSDDLAVPENVRLFLLPPRTPEMNPIEQIWAEIRKRGFKNKLFATIQQVIDKFIGVVFELTERTITNITLREWIYQVF